MFCGACLPSDMLETRNECARLQSDYNTDQVLTRDRGRCDGKMIIWTVDLCKSPLKPTAKCFFLHQNRRTTQHQLHGETMSIGVSRSDAHPAWSVRGRSGGRVGPADTRRRGGNHARQERWNWAKNRALVDFRLPSQARPGSVL